MGDIKKAIEWAVNIANSPESGYDQQHRNGPDYDCSSFISTALSQAGYKISPKSWTGNMRKQLLDDGWTICAAPFKAGDVHLNYDYHVCMSIDDSRIVEARLNEEGGIVGGETGDQTGREIWIRDYYDYPRGWDVHLRPPQNTTNLMVVYMEAIKDTLLGYYGNGHERKSKLKAAGFDPDVVQNTINYLYHALNGD